MKLTTYELVLCAFCAAVTCILAPLSVPLAGEVPISLATFAVLLSGILLGGKLGALSQIVYVLLGSVGVPVFAGWTGGIGITLGVTGGYIIGYIPMALAAGLIYHRFGRNESGIRKYCVIPFLPGDLIKIAAVALTAVPIEAAIKRTVPAGQGAA